MGRKIRKASSSKLNSGCSALFFVPFAALGTIFFVMVFGKPAAQMLDARDWQPTTCTIQTSEVEVSRSSDGDSYRVGVTYTYEVDGRLYNGDRFNFSEMYSSGYGGKAEAVAEYPPDLETLCWVDPDDPSRSVIDRSPGLFLLWGLFPIVFMAIGFGGIAYSLFGKDDDKERKALRSGRRPGPASRWASTFRRGSRREMASHRDATSRQASTHEPQAVARRLSTGAIVLEESTSPRAKVFGALFATLFWNGIVSIFFFKWEEVDGCAKLFLMPFAAAGLGLAGWLVHSILALFNPRPVLTLESDELTLGQTLGLAWRLEGNAGRLEALTIDLVGSESATYRVGTNSRTETSEHHRTRVVELAANEVRYAHRGSAELSLPAGSAPSFKSSNNAFAWRLEVRGEIPRWPDISLDFPLAIAGSEDGMDTDALADPFANSFTSTDDEDPAPQAVHAGAPDGTLDEGLRLTLDRQAYAPGEELTGKVEWQTGAQRPERVVLSLLWHTAGKGTEDVKVIEQESLGTPGPRGEEHFQFRLPRRPWSVSGTLVSIVWAVEASSEPKGDVERLEIVVAPGRQEIFV